MEEVLCPYTECSERGKAPRCYNDIYRFCNILPRDKPSDKQLTNRLAEELFKK